MCLSCLPCAELIWWFTEISSSSGAKTYSESNHYHFMPAYFHYYCCPCFLCSNYSLIYFCNFCHQSQWISFGYSTYYIFLTWLALMLFYPFVNFSSVFPFDWSLFELSLRSLFTYMYSLSACHLRKPSSIFFSIPYSKKSSKGLSWLLSCHSCLSSFTVLFCFPLGALGFGKKKKGKNPEGITITNNSCRIDACHIALKDWYFLFNISSCDSFLLWLSNLFHRDACFT